MNGLHILAEFLGCEVETCLLHDVTALRALCLGVCRDAGLLAVSDAFHTFGGDGAQTGATGVVVLAESHLAIHTWPEFRAVTLDIYVCNVRKDSSTGAEYAYRLLEDAFHPAVSRRQTIVRGALGACASGQVATTGDPALERTRIHSPGLRAAAYDPARRVLEIEFPDGAVYQYQNVPPDLYRQFMASQTKRSFFEDRIEETYSRRRV